MSLEQIKELEIQLGMKLPEDYVLFVTQIGDGWDKDKLQEYLIQSSNKNFELQIKLYFAQFRKNGDFADLLFEFLLNEDYDGSDCQIGAACFIGKLDRSVLKERKTWLLKAQENEVFWRRPFQTDEYLEWIK